MAEVVGIAAGAVGFAGTLYTSIKTLHDMINSWVNAPQTLCDLLNGVKALQEVLMSLKIELEKATENNSSPQ